MTRSKRKTPQAPSLDPTTQAIIDTLASKVGQLPVAEMEAKTNAERLRRELREFTKPGLAGFADRLVYLLESHKMTRGKLADLIGVSKDITSKYALGTVRPGAEKVQAIARQFGLKSDDIFPDYARTSKRGAAGQLNGHTRRSYEMVTGSSPDFVNLYVDKEVPKSVGEIIIEMLRAVDRI